MTRRPRVTRFRPSIVLGLAALTAAIGAGTAYATVSAPGPAYRLATATLAQVSATLQVVGTLSPAQQADVPFPVGGTVATVAVQAGQRVTAGQVLGKLSTAALRAELTAAQSTLAQANLLVRTTLPARIRPLRLGFRVWCPGSGAGSGSGGSGGSGSGRFRRGVRAGRVPGGGGSGSGPGRPGPRRCVVQQAVLRAQRQADHALARARTGAGPGQPGVRQPGARAVPQRDTVGQRNASPDGTRRRPGVGAPPGAHRDVLPGAHCDVHADAYRDVHAGQLCPGHQAGAGRRDRGAARAAALSRRLTALSTALAKAVAAGTGSGRGGGPARSPAAAAAPHPGRAAPAARPGRSARPSWPPTRPPPTRTRRSSPSPSRTWSTPWCSARSVAP